jgi:TetR/AcrR family transcriptional regulator
LPYARIVRLPTDADKDEAMSDPTQSPGVAPAMLRTEPAPTESSAGTPFSLENRPDTPMSPAPAQADAAPSSAEDVGADESAAEAPGPAARVRKRPKPGERRVQILQTLAAMLEQPGAERITTAALAARLSVSEAALYRHFASKAQMFEGLIEFIESSVFTLINQILERQAEGAEQTQRIVTVLLQFGEKNPGMTRVMVGDALVFEHERLTARMNQFFDRVESQLRQTLRLAAEAAGSSTPTVEAQALASALTALTVGRLQRYARSGFKRLPTEHLDLALRRLCG